MLRVTEGMIFRQVTNSVAKAQQRAYEAQTIAQTGRRVNRVSDDPIAASRASVLDSTIERLKGMGRVAARAQEELTVAESTLGEASVILTRAREIAIAGANSSMGADSRAALAQEIDGLRSQMVTLANAQVADVYVFGGHQTLTEPFDDTGAYSGDSGIRSAEVAPGTSVTMNITGDNSFIGTVNIFDELETLRDELNNDDPDAVAAVLDQLESGLQQLNTARTRSGVYLGQLRSSEDLRFELESSALTHRSEATDADINESFNALAQTQFNLQSAISQAQRILAGLTSR